MNHSLIKVLLIEDNPGDARLLQELLAEVTLIQFQLHHVDRLRQGINLLKTESFDVILLDLSLPDSQELATFIALHQQVPGIPIVVITGLNDETLALRAVHEGAQDYLLKGQLTSDLLTRAIRYAIERHQAEQKIREQAALLDVATDAILLRDWEGQILFWNKGAERIYGWKAETVLGKKANELLYQQPLKQFEEAQKILIETGEWQGELNHVTSEGRSIIVSSRWVLLYDDHQKPKSVLIVSTDITEKKLLEAQFLRAQRMESIGTLASGIAHDLNNILTPVLAVSQLLQMKLSTIDERDQELLAIVATNARRGAALVKQVLSFARGAEGKHTILQIKHLLWEVQQIIQETFPKSIAVQTSLPENLWVITGEPTQLHQVLMNLCINARDAMPDGGVLKITATNCVLDESYTQMNLEAKVGSYLMITIGDTGIGMSPETIDRIFEPFFTTKEIGQGTGLGLSTALGIIKSHGGFIDVKSAIGQGTQFKIYLPAVNAAEQPENQDYGIPMGENELILIVDDEAAIREISRVSLESFNYRVLSASDGIEAITIYAQHKHEISLAIVDIMMPSLDGAVTIRTLQKINPKIKIIAVSGLMSNSQLNANSIAGTHRFLAKPYTAKDLLVAVHQALHAKTANPLQAIENIAGDRG
ncbi:MAG TPA: response regulator [Trichocoleus sp.]|jgi:PAS domain S-box-containing protein